MARFSIGVFAAACILASGVAWAVDDVAEKLEAQRKAAKANWALVEGGELAIHETPHLIVCAPSTMAKKLKDLGTVLEKHYVAAEKTLQIKPIEELWAGKLTVYVFPEREPFTAFVRRVEKRRLTADEVGSMGVEGDLAHAVATAPRSKLDASLEAQAGEQIAAALLQRKAGAKVPLPEWLLRGFGRATLWRSSPLDKTYQAERKLAQGLVTGKKRMAQEVWNSTLDIEEAVPLRASLADFLAYGPGYSKFPAILAGFKPGENLDSHTFDQALGSAGLKPELIETRWRDWVLRGGK
jgi:hypothetical protein